MPTPIRAIQTREQFRAFVLEWLETDFSGYSESLEIYLRRLHHLLEQQRDQTPSWSLFADLIASAVAAPPAELASGWLEIRLSPNPSQDAYDSLIDVLRFQIADLHRLRAAGIYHKTEAELWLGWDSPSGARWYNFFPRLFLSCAAYGLSAEDDSAACSWADLEDFLDCGQYTE